MEAMDRNHGQEDKDIDMDIDTDMPDRPYCTDFDVIE